MKKIKKNNAKMSYFQRGKRLKQFLSIWPSVTTGNTKRIMAGFLTGILAMRLKAWASDASSRIAIRNFAVKLTKLIFCVPR